MSGSFWDYFRRGTSGRAHPEAKHHGKKRPKYEDPDYVKVIRKTMTAISKRTTDIFSICTRLIDADILTISEQEEIMSSENRSEEKKFFELAKKFMRKDRSAYDTFKKILEDTGNAHVVTEMNAEEENLMGRPHANTNTNGDNGEGGGTTSKEVPSRARKTKKGKLFSIYEASDSDNDDEDDDGHMDEKPAPIDWDNEDPDMEALIALLLYLDWHFRNHYYFIKPYTVHRFDHQHDQEQSSPQPNFEAQIPKKMVNVSIQGFRVDRAIYLRDISLYGPSRRPVASYEVDLKVVLMGDVGGENVIAEWHRIVDVKRNDLMTFCLDEPIPIRPHQWHWIKFTIKGAHNFAVQSEDRKVDRTEVTYSADDWVQFEFKTSRKKSTCQLPQMTFHKAKVSIPSSVFPKVPHKTIKKTKWVKKTLWTILSIFAIGLTVGIIFKSSLIGALVWVGGMIFAGLFFVLNRRFGIGKKARENYCCCGNPPREYTMVPIHDDESSDIARHAREY